MPGECAVREPTRRPSHKSHLRCIPRASGLRRTSFEKAPHVDELGQLPLARTSRQVTMWMGRSAPLLGLGCPNVAQVAEPVLNAVETISALAQFQEPYEHIAPFHLPTSDRYSVGDTALPRCSLARRSHRVSE